MAAAARGVAAEHCCCCYCYCCFCCWRWHWTLAPAVCPGCGCRPGWWPAAAQSGRWRAHTSLKQVAEVEGRRLASRTRAGPELRVAPCWPAGHAPCSRDWAGGLSVPHPLTSVALPSNDQLALLQAGEALEEGLQAGIEVCCQRHLISGQAASLGGDAEARADGLVDEQQRGAPVPCPCSGQRQTRSMA